MYIELWPTTCFVFGIHVLVSFKKKNQSSTLIKDAIDPRIFYAVNQKIFTDKDTLDIEVKFK